MTAEELKGLLDYDPNTGIFRWKVTRGGTARQGAIAGHRNRAGYWRVFAMGKAHAAHRLAWLYVTGEWPPGDLDHCDGDRSNNAFTNLRLATVTQNMMNASRPKHNTSGFKGVTFRRDMRRWRAQIGWQGGTISIGHFDTPEEAHAAYLAKARELYGEFARAG